MLADLLALLDKPVLLLVVMAIGGVVGIGLERTLQNLDRERRQAYWRGRNAAKGKNGKAAPFKRDAAPVDAAADQLKTVMRADFKSRALLNKPEGQVFRALDKIVLARNPSWQVMAQVSLGEFLASEDREAYGCINSKRVFTSQSDVASI